MQEALTRVFARWSRVGGDQPHAYARRVLVNLHTDRWRGRRREVVTDEVPEPRPAPAAGHRVDLAVDLVAELQALPAREHQCVVLRYYMDLSERDTAATLGVAVGTVKSSTSRGLAALRAALSTQEEISHV